MVPGIQYEPDRAADDCCFVADLDRFVPLDHYRTTAIGMHVVTKHWDWVSVGRHASAFT